MPEWYTAFTAGTEPTVNDIETFVGSPLLKKLMEHLEKTYGSAPLIEYSNCSAQKGWNIKYKKGRKALCTIYPMDGYFIAMVSVSPKNEPNVELILPSFSEYTQQLYNGSRSLPRMGRWLMIEVREEAVLEDAMRLIETKFTK